VTELVQWHSSDCIATVQTGGAEETLYNAGQPGQ